MEKKIFPVLLCMLVVSVLINSCMGQAKTPGIQFESTTYNFGTIEEGRPVNCVFEFTNSGTQTLVVKEVHPTCGCTVAGDFDKEVMPGQTGRIPVTFKTSGYDGPVAKVIIVKTNVTENPDITLNIEGIVKVAVSLDPKILSFGTIERERTIPLEGKISISNRLAEPVKITGIVKITDDITIPNVTLSTDNVETVIETIQDGFQYVLDITVNPPFKHGEVMGTILIKTSNNILPEIHTQFSYFMEPMVKVYPNPLFVSKDKIVNGEEQLINIECEPGSDMRIADLSVNIDKVNVSLHEVEKGRRFTVILKFPKNFTFDPANTLTVKFKVQNVPDEPVFGVPVLGI